MTLLLSRANNNYLLQEHPVGMYEEVTIWMSELEFCNTELSFLAKLLDKTFLRTSAKQLEELTRLDRKLKSFSSITLNDLHKLLSRHEQHLSEIDIDEFSITKKIIGNEHEALLFKMKGFMKEVKQIKIEIFKIVDEKLKGSKRDSITKKISRDYEEGVLAL